MATIDFAKFSRNMLYIKTKDQSLAQLKFNGAQVAIWAVVQEMFRNGVPVRLAILKARQLGISTFCQALLFWRVMTHPFTNALAIAHDAESTARIFEMSRTFYDYMPVRPMRRYSTKKELVLENPNDAARIYAPGLRSRLELRTAGTKGAGRGTTVHALHASEVALWPKADVLASSLFPTVPYKKGTIIVLESTAHGAGDWWHSFWEESKAGGLFTPIFIPWFVLPEYSIHGATREQFLDSPLGSDERELRKEYDLKKSQLAWRRMRIRELGGEELFRQEYPCNDVEAWLVQGRPLFNVGRLKEALQGVAKGVKGYMTPDCTFRPESRGPVLVWEPPQDGATYYVGVDSASGSEGGDASVIQVVRCDDNGFTQVACWYGHVDPVVLAHEAEKLAKWYNTAVVSVEINYHGIATQMELRHHYYNLFRWRVFDRMVDKPTEKIGWETNVRTKPLLIAFMAHCIREGSVKMNDKHLIEEAMHFIEDEEAPGTGSAASGFTDDRIMAFMVACYCASLDGAGTGASGTSVQEVRPQDFLKQPFEEDLVETGVSEAGEGDYHLSHHVWGAHKRFGAGKEDEPVDWRVL